MKIANHQKLLELEQYGRSSSNIGVENIQMLNRDCRISSRTLQGTELFKTCRQFKRWIRLIEF